MRILGWYIVLLVVAISASLLLERRVLLDRLDEEVEAQLVQERAKIANLATGCPTSRPQRPIVSTATLL